jgi:hypothetical protein
MTGQRSLSVVHRDGMQERNHQVGIKGRWSIGDVSAAMYMSYYELVMLLPIRVFACSPWPTRHLHLIAPDPEGQEDKEPALHVQHYQVTNHKHSMTGNANNTNKLASSPEQMQTPFHSSQSTSQVLVRPRPTTTGAQ